MSSLRRCPDCHHYECECLRDRSRSPHRRETRGYLINRDDHYPISERRYVSVDEANEVLSRAPAPSTGTSKKYPKRHRNGEGQYRDPSPARAPLREYVGERGTGATFNYAGQTGSSNATNGFDPGYERILTDHNKDLQGMSIHPVGNPTGYERVNAIKKSKLPGRELEVEYPKKEYGKSRVVAKHNRVKGWTDKHCVVM